MDHVRLVLILRQQLHYHRRSLKRRIWQKKWQQKAIYENIIVHPPTKGRTRKNEHRNQEPFSDRFGEEQMAAGKAPDFWFTSTPWKSEMVSKDKKHSGAELFFEQQQRLWLFIEGSVSKVVWLLVSLVLPLLLLLLLLNRHSHGGSGCVCLSCFVLRLVLSFVLFSQTSCFALQVPLCRNEARYDDLTPACCMTYKLDANTRASLLVLHISISKPAGRGSEAIPIGRWDFPGFQTDVYNISILLISKAMSMESFTCPKMTFQL